MGGGDNMLENVLEIILWTLRFVTSVLNLLSSVKKSRPSDSERDEREKNTAILEVTTYR